MTQQSTHREGGYGQGFGGDTIKEMTHTTQQSNHAAAAVFIFVSVFVFVTWPHSHWCCNRSRTHNNQNKQIIRPYLYSCSGFVRIRAPAEHTTINTKNQHSNQQ